MTDGIPADAPAILLVAPDDELRYLMERYARRGGFELRVSADGAGSPAAVWVSSVQVVEVIRPRERGLVSEDTPLIVICPEADEARARELGADHRVGQQFTYQDLMAALSAVGVAR